MPGRAHRSWATEPAREESFAESYGKLKSGAQVEGEAQRVKAKPKN